MPLSCLAVEETLQHGGELVAKVLQAHNVRFVFTLTGGHISPILTSAEEIGIRVIDVRHEVHRVCPLLCARLSVTARE